MDEARVAAACRRARERTPARHWHGWMGEIAQLPHQRPYLFFAQICSPLVAASCVAEGYRLAALDAGRPPGGCTVVISALALDAGAGWMTRYPGDMAN